MGDQTLDEYTTSLFNYITHNNVTKCPEATPFVEAGSSECSNCTEETPIFDLNQGICISCENGTVFNPETHQCIEQ